MLLSTIKNKSAKGAIFTLLAAVMFLVSQDVLASHVVAPLLSGQVQQEKLLLAAMIEDEKRPQREPLDEQQQEKDRTSWAFYIDNDLFASSGRDRDYTGGLAFTLSGSKTVKYLVSVDPLLGGINNLFGLGKKYDSLLHSFEFGLTAFTPDDITISEPIFDDRPYASLLYVSNTRQHVDYKNRSSLITSLSIGVLGLDIAGEFQNKVHKLFDANEAQGWGNQISDGGELTFRYSVSKQSVHWADYADEKSNYEIKTASNLNVGYLTDYTYSISGRFGRIRTPWWSFNPQNAAYAEKGSSLAKTSTKTKNEFYFWTGLSVHLRAYNVFLQGQFRDSVVTYKSDELNHVVGELWMGVTTELDSGLRMSYFLRGQTSEIKTGPGSRDLVWGGFIISRAL